MVGLGAEPGRLASIKGGMGISAGLLGWSRAITKVRKVRVKQWGYKSEG